MWVSRSPSPLSNPEVLRNQVTIRYVWWYTFSISIRKMSKPKTNLRCLMCGSEDVRNFAAETLIHLPGMKNLDKPGVLVFPTLLICLDCGTAQFVVPDAELHRLTDRGSTSN